MSELLNFYQQQASAHLSSTPWLARLQEKALIDFSRYGFPTRHLEDWKYTTVDALAQQRFLRSNATAKNSVPSKHPAIGCSIRLVNGVVIGAEEARTVLPAGVIVQSLPDALVQHEEKIKPYLNKILKQEHGFQALNTAMLQSGLFIYIPAGIQVAMPLFLSHWQDTENQANYLRHIIVAEAGSSVTIIEDYAGCAETAYFTNTITEAYVGAKANLTHYKIQREGKKAYHVGHLAVKQAESSEFVSHSVSVGGKLVRSDITIGLEEPKAHCVMNGVYAPAEGQHIDHHTIVRHDVPDCHSEQDYKGILSGHSRAVFNGRVIVAKDAQHTQAKQQNKNLLLSTKAEIDTKPQLEIFANDVICTHGATVGQLDEDALFYLAARGIGQAQAHRFLVQAFAAENIRAFAHPELIEWVSALLDEQIG